MRDSGPLSYAFRRLSAARDNAERGRPVGLPLRRSLRVSGASRRSRRPVPAGHDRPRRCSSEADHRSDGSWTSFRTARAEGSSKSVDGELYLSSRATLVCFALARPRPMADPLAYCGAAWGLLAAPFELIFFLTHTLACVRRSRFQESAEDPRQPSVCRLSPLGSQRPRNRADHTDSGAAAEYRRRPPAPQGPRSSRPPNGAESPASAASGPDRGRRRSCSAKAGRPGSAPACTPSAPVLQTRPGTPA